MPEPREDDLFRESTMTFGEHLGELRGCLLRSIYGLALGFIIGLTIGGHVVSFIQRPLTHALATYYERDTAERVRREVEKLDRAQMERLIQAEMEKSKKSGQATPLAYDEAKKRVMERLIQAEIEKSKKSGQATPLSRDEAKKQVEDAAKRRAEDEVRTRVVEERLLADEVYIDPRGILQQLKDTYPEQFEGVPALPERQSSAGSEPKDLIRVFLWHRRADDARLQSKGLSVLEGFGVYLKASLLIGVLLAGPWIFYQIWNFVAAGLYPHERRYVHLYLPFSIGLFLAGAALAFFVVFGPVLDFLLSFNRSMEITPEARINEWLSFVWVLPVGFGVGFQLPLVMLFMERIGVLTVQSYMKQWRIAVLVIFVIAGILMPPDPYSMILMAASLTILYFGGVLLCKLLPRKSKQWQ